MKIFSAEQIRRWDQFTIENEPVSSVALMERAATAAARWIQEQFNTDQPVFVFCGSGNNGGDGLVIARHLYQKGFNITVFIKNISQEFSPDATHNFQFLKEISGIGIMNFADFNPDDIPGNAVIVEALFGTGLNRSVHEEEEQLIRKINQIKVVKIAIDIPGGLFADRIADEGATVFEADFTLSFQTWKKSFLHPETRKYCGKVHILDIGLSPEFLECEESSESVITDDYVRSIYRTRDRFSHKGDHGKVCIVGGSKGMAGAAVLAVKAAARTGSGITMIQSPECNRVILQTACPEAIFISNGSEKITEIQQVSKSVFAMGPGMGTDREAEAALRNFLQNHHSPVVLDADALNIVSQTPDLMDLIPRNSVITPHPKEFNRLFGTSDDSYSRSKVAAEKAFELGIFIILKGHHTQIFTPDGEIRYNITGNAGMAKGGFGDVLTGIIAALMAQGYSVFQSCNLGVWLHGKAADFAVEGQHSDETILPQDLTEELGKAFKFLQRSDF